MNTVRQIIADCDICRGINNRNATTSRNEASQPLKYINVCLIQSQYKLSSKIIGIYIQARIPINFCCFYCFPPEK